MLAHDLFGDDRVALYATVLYLFTPARVFFFPLMNAVTPVFVLLFRGRGGEIGDHWQTRLWIFLACFFQLAAAYVCGTLNHRAAIAAVLGIARLQDCFPIGTIGFVVP